MDNTVQLSKFGIILIFIITGILFVLAIYALSKFTAPNKPNPEKLSPYECGVKSTGGSCIPINIRFYILALAFLLFEVEIAFLFPWSLVFADKNIIGISPIWGWFTLLETGAFIIILLLGLAYIWAKGDLNQMKPAHISSKAVFSVPENLYAKVNEKYALGSVIAKEDNKKL